MPQLYLARLNFKSWEFNILGFERRIVFIGITQHVPKILRKGYKISECSGTIEQFVVELEEYMRGKRKEFSYEPEFLWGTDFQKNVWKNLRKIPYGETVSYAQFARIIGLGDNYARAVGNACQANPIPILVPCHRIVKATGALGGYSGGMELKNYLISLEKRFK
ncbi:MAG: methylated-DNA--[protein]-cysteine S-methyltransferase [bacterium]